MKLLLLRYRICTVVASLVLPMAGSAFAASVADRPESSASSLSRAAPSFSALAIQDLEAARSALAAAHPGLAGEVAPRLARWFDEGYEEAVVLARAARTPRQAFASLKYFLAGFEDGHVTAFASPTLHGKFGWAGWSARFNGHAFEVVDVARDWDGPLPSPGAQLIECDGKPIQTFIEQRIGPFVDVRYQLEGTQSMLGAMVSNRHPAYPLWKADGPSECGFLSPSGKHERVPLTWRETGEGLQRLARPSNGVGVEVWGAGYWIWANDFDPVERNTKDADAMLAAIAAMPSSARFVVLDTRGNEGGSGVYGYEILSTLMRSATPREEPDVRAFWRVSEIAYKALSEAMRQEQARTGGESTRGAGLASVVRELSAALVADGPAMVEDFSGEALPAPPQGPGFAGKVVLVTDNRCASACLDFVDAARRIPGVLHVGQPTSGDTEYAEVVTHPLPSGASMWVPLKAWKGRSRGVNKPVVPTARFPGDISDTDGLRKWLRKLLVNDVLARDEPTFVSGN